MSPLDPLPGREISADPFIIEIREALRNKKTDYVQKIPKRRNPPLSPPIWEYPYFFTDLFVVAIFKPLN